MPRPFSTFLCPGEPVFGEKENSSMWRVQSRKCYTGSFPSAISQMQDCHRPIHRITSCSPADDRSPFYDPSCSPVKPVARLHILKQREYKKVCEDGSDIEIGPWNVPGNAVDSGLGMGAGGIYNGRGIGPSDPIPFEMNKGFSEMSQNQFSQKSSPTVSPS